jgi:hypothetical protein
MNFQRLQSFIEFPFTLFNNLNLLKTNSKIIAFQKLFFCTLFCPLESVIGGERTPRFHSPKYITVEEIVTTYLTE